MKPGTEEFPECEVCAQPEGVEADWTHGDEESAGVSRNHRSPKGNTNMRRLLNQSANAAVKLKGNIFQILYRRLSPAWDITKPLASSLTSSAD